MATFLDVTGLEHFLSIFVFLFVWIVVYAILLWTKILGENKFISALIGLLLGIFVLLSKTATAVIAKTAPFLAVVFVLTILITIAARMLGGEVEGMGALSGIFLIFIIIIVVIGAMVQLRGQLTVSETPKDLSKTLNLIFHPTFLGIVLIFAVSVFTIALLANKAG